MLIEFYKMRRAQAHHVVIRLPLGRIDSDRGKHGSRIQVCKVASVRDATPQLDPGHSFRGEWGAPDVDLDRFELLRKQLEQQVYLLANYCLDESSIRDNNKFRTFPQKYCSVPSSRVQRAMTDAQNAVTESGHRKKEELRSFLFLTAVMVPVLTVMFIAAYGFVVWFYQLLIAGPPH
jgi:periplasmic nitrate reductase NapE